MRCGIQIDGNRGKDSVFAEIDSLLSRVQKEEQDARKSGVNLFFIEVSLLRFFVFYVELCFNQIEIPADLGSI